jgi:hypothetical protein
VRDVRFTPSGQAPTSALPPKADIAWRNWNVRFVQELTFCAAAKNVGFDYLVSESKSSLSHSAATIMTMPIVGMFQMIERAKGKSAVYKNA